MSEHRLAHGGAGTIELPIAPLLGDIANALDRHAVVIVCGATGSGKSTQVPQLCLTRDPRARIALTQPRRIAARAIAARVAGERGERPGATVGYQTRFERQLSDATRLKVMTDGILLQEISRDPDLGAYDIVIIDEVHERSLNVDFLVGYLRMLLARRPTLRVILMSATVEAERFQDFFGTAGVVEIPGATHPVEVRYRPPAGNDDGAFHTALVTAIRELDAAHFGDILVFLPGEREISDAADVIRGARLTGTEILPLYARLGSAEQQRVFAPHASRHIVLATNVAETSLTVPGVCHVIDSGLARISTYNARSKLQRLPIVPISRASAEQRKGRCGRERPGICIRLYSEEQFARRASYTEPELRRSNLGGVILRLADLGLGGLDDFPLLDAPTSTAINDGYLLLRELGAVDTEKALSPVGRQLARLPLDPRLARMLVAAARGGCLREVLVIVSAISAGDIRERPADARGAADQAHARFRDHRSDFMWYLNAWRAIENEVVGATRRQQQAICRSHYWSWRRVREWIDVHRELNARAAASGWRAREDTPASYRAIHEALLAGLASRIARREQKLEYTGCRHQRLRLHPASALRAGGAPKWIVAAEITETNATYARTAARIDPNWAARAAEHLVRRSYTEPAWDASRGEVYRLEEQALYGLTLLSGRRVPLHEQALPEAREVFVRIALVGGELEAMPGFLAHNLDLVAKVRAAEERARRRDLLADESELERFYLERLPPHIATRRQLLAWLRGDRRHDELLRMTEDVVTRRGIETVSDYLYPSALSVSDMWLPLSYRFAPGDEDDGVTVTIPVAAVDRVPGQLLERLVPGFLAEKIGTLIKRLPKDLRRHLSPLAEFAQALTAAIEEVPGPLPEALSTAAARMTGAHIPATAWRTDDLPTHLTMRVDLVGADGRTVAAVRDLPAWLAAAPTTVIEAFAAVPWGLSAAAHDTWAFGKLPEVVGRRVAGIEIRGYPALRDLDGRVVVEVCRTRDAALETHRAGVIALLGRALPQEMKHLRKEVMRLPKLELQLRRLNLSPGLGPVLQRAALERALGERSLPRDAGEFEALRVAVAREVVAAFSDCLTRLESLLDTAVVLVTEALPTVEARFPEVAADVLATISDLFRPGFLWRDAVRLTHYPRYLRALGLRLERATVNPPKEAQARAIWDALNAQCVAADAALDGGARERLREMRHELRVALFAPGVRTAEKISVQRIEEFLTRCGAFGPVSNPDGVPPG